MIRRDIKEFIKTIPSSVTLVAATKYGDATDLKRLYDAGVTNFGENRVDAFLSKYESLKDFDIPRKPGDDFDIPFGKKR